MKYFISSNSVSDTRNSYDPKIYKPIDVLKCALKHSVQRNNIVPETDTEKMLHEMKFLNS